MLSADSGSWLCFANPVSLSRVDVKSGYVYVHVPEQKEGLFCKLVVLIASKDILLISLSYEASKLNMDLTYSCIYRQSYSFKETIPLHFIPD
jgi:hypothetical protein